MDEDTQCKMNWPSALVVSAVIHAAGLGLFVVCSDSPGEDGGETAASAEERQTAPVTDMSETEPDETASPSDASAPVPPVAGEHGATVPRNDSARSAAAGPSRVPAPSNDAVPAPPRPVSVDTVVYTVQRGDHLTKISKRFKCTITEIAKLNNIKPNSGLAIGQKLKIPAPAE